MKEISIIIPTFNEKKNIHRLIKNIKKVVPKAHIVIVDDSIDSEIGNIIKKNKYLHVIIIIEKTPRVEVQLSYLV